jgi:hypothetical protein
VDIGEEAGVTDAMKAVRQGVEQEAADEFTGAEGDDLRLAGVAIVFPAEGDFILGHGHQPRVCHGDAVRGAAEIGQHLFRPAERRLGNPFQAPQVAEATSEDGRFGEVGEIVLDGGAQLVEEEAAEKPRKDADRQEEARPAGDPAGALGRRATAGYDAMDMGMMLQRLPPGVRPAGQAGGTTSSASRSSGLCVRRISPFETRV